MAPDLERLARTPWPMACCASSGTNPFKSALARSCSRNAGCVRANVAGEFCPGIRCAHIDDAERGNARLRRLDAEKGRGFAALDTTPELPLSSDDEVLVKGIRRDFDSNPPAAAGNHRKYRSPPRNNPKVMLQLWRILFRPPLLPRTPKAT